MKVILIVIALLLMFPAAHQGSQDSLVVVGTGKVKYLGLFKVYEATLKVEPRVKRSEVLSSSSSRCLELQYALTVKADDIRTAADTILGRQHDDGTIAPIRQYIDQLHESYRSVEDGDIYSLCYQDHTQKTELHLNNTLLTTISSGEFARVYFGIWLGEKLPIDEDLRDDLLQNL